MGGKRKGVAVFTGVFLFRLLFLAIHDFPLRSDFFQRAAVMKNIAKGTDHTQFLNPELFYQLGSLVYHLPIDPLWTFRLVTPAISALGIATVFYVTAEIFGERDGYFAAFALVVMSIISFRSMYGWQVNSYITAFVFLPLFILTVYRWIDSGDNWNLLYGSLLILLIGGFHHLVFVETIAILAFAFFLVDRRVAFFLPAIFLNIGVMWENYGRYLYSRGVGMVDILWDNVRSLLDSTEAPAPNGNGSGPPPSVSSFSESLVLNILSLLAMVNPITLVVGGYGLSEGVNHESENYHLASMILISWVLAQVGLIVFTHKFQPNATERTIRHLYIPFAMAFGFGLGSIYLKIEQRGYASKVFDVVDYRRLILAFLILTSIPILAYQVYPFGATGLGVESDSEIVSGLQAVSVNGTILAPPLTGEVVAYFHDGPVFKTYPRDHDFPNRILQSQSRVWRWWDDPTRCHILSDVGIDWVFIKKGDYFRLYWNNPENVRVPQEIDVEYLRVFYDNSAMRLYEVGSCSNPTRVRSGS